MTQYRKRLTGPGQKIVSYWPDANGYAKQVGNIRLGPGDRGVVEAVSVNRALAAEIQRLTGIVRTYDLTWEQRAQTRATELATAGRLYHDMRWMAAEVVAWDYEQVETRVPAQWMSSSAHRNVITDPQWKHVGIGVAPGKTANGAACFYVAGLFAWSAA